MTILANRILRSFTIFALLLNLATAVTIRSIPSTQDNQDFFSLAQALLSNGQRKISSCGPELPEIERCIQVCNSPGLAERGGCCCIARTDNFFIGLRGGCRYSQRVQNFTSRFIYKSSPVSVPNRYFSGTSCAKIASTGTGGPCTCSIQYEADTELLAMASPLPTPSVTPSPVLTATSSPVPSKSPAVSPEPSFPPETTEPTTEETLTPTPDSILVPTAPDPSIPSQQPTERPTEGPATETVDPSSTDDIDDGFGIPDPSEPGEVTPFPTEDSEQQASEDDGSVCVDERYLEERGFGTDSLVHEEGVMANVLCPHGGSLPCGTADHKVRVGGQDMSYEYMCARPDVQCRADRMKVNSVYSHMWSDVAHEDIVLTMFDMRYGETAQKALHTVMHGWRSAKKRVFA